MKKVLFINIALLFILIYVCISYNHRQAIVNTERPIEDFSVLEINCSSGYRGGSTLLVEFNAKKYYVGITSRQCKSFTLDKVKIYYDKENDKLFERNELTIRYIVFYSIIYLCSFIWLYIIIKKNYKIITLVMFSVLFLLCSCRYESQMIDSGNAIVKQIDSYIDSVGTVPMSLTDIGITIIDEGNPPFYYQRIDSVHYTLSFSNGVGESKIYYSDSQKWEDFPRTIGK